MELFQVLMLPKLKKFFKLLMKQPWASELEGNLLSPRIGLDYARTLPEWDLVRFVAMTRSLKLQDPSPFLPSLLARPAARLVAQGSGCAFSFLQGGQQS